MKILRYLIIAVALFTGFSLNAQTEYKLNDKPNGFSLGNRSNNTTILIHNVNAISIEKADHDGLEGQYITFEGIHIANEAGAPDLPSGSAFIAIPNGSTPSIKMASMKTKTIKNVDLIPAPQPQLDDDNSPAMYQKNMDIYGKNALYPASPYNISEVMTIRGVEMVQVGVMPFQYNPVTKELIVYENLELEITTEGGDGTYGDIRYRTPEWDQILSDMLLNRETLPEVDYGMKYRKHYENRETGCEYMIIIPDNEEFAQLADSIKQFRTNQGIPTEVFTVSQCGGNDGQAIRNFIRNAYNNWDMPPAAVLILGDHNTDPTKGVVSFTMNNHPGGGGYNPYISDHAYAVMDNTHMPEIIMGRITGRDYEELYRMIKKDLDYERTPPTNPGFYDHPITAMGFQLERWFQLCSEIVNGFWEYELEKNPVRINAIYQGTPGSRWSTNENTNAVLSYFGPSGCGYIPNNMSHLTDWTGNGNKINEAVNDGAFILQHRDHGAEERWGEPGYSIGYINRLANPDLTYVMSCNCLTGRFNYSGENGCFAEAFHRHQQGALGLIAATQVSYSFVNDVYVWGAYDNMWPEFMPTYGTQHATNFLLPAFGNAAGKYFLSQSSWADDGVKEITYYLFHQHGDAYMNLYSEAPQPLNVEMLPVLVAGSTHYQVKADEGSTICLTANGQIIGFGYATGNPQTITVTPQETGTRVTLTIKKQNYYRYEHELATIPAGEPYLIFHAVGINDNEGNANQEVDYNETCHFSISLHNVGSTGIDNVNATLSCEHPQVQIIQGFASYGTINSSDMVQVDNAFTVQFGDDLNDGEHIRFHLLMDNGTMTFADSVDLVVNAPVLQYSDFELTDLEGTPMDRLMPGTSSLITLNINNEGHSTSLSQTHEIALKAPFVNIVNKTLTVDGLEPGTHAKVTFQVNVDNLSEGNIIDCAVNAESGSHTALHEQKVPMGYTIEDFDDDVINPCLGYDLGTGDKTWYIVAEEGAVGGYCVRSPQTADKKKVNMFIAINCNTMLTVSFRHKVSADDGDQLIFYINNHEMGAWSGETEWETSEFPLNSGNNVLKFTYKKDAEGSAGDDCVFIDDLHLPPLEELIVFAGNDDTICQTSTYIPNGYACHQQGLVWSTDGDGSFDDSTLETPVYTFGPNDLENRQVALTMTGTSTLSQQQDASQVNIILKENPAYIQNIESPTGDTLVDLRLVSQSEYHSDIETSSDFVWFMEPEQAGEITAEGSHATVLWNSSFRGTAHLSYQLSNDCGESDRSETLTVRVVNSTSISETGDDTALEVYPNPASHQIELKASHLQGETVVIRIIDPLGRTVINKQKGIEAGVIDETLNISALRNGIYDLQVIDGSHIHSTRIIIKK